jgi:hypothetical protein
LKSKLADEEHKYGTLSYQATEYENDLRHKNTVIALLQDLNSEMKLNVSAANFKLRTSEDEIRVLWFSNQPALNTDILFWQALKARISEERQSRDVEITSLRMQSKREIAAFEAKLAQSSSQYVFVPSHFYFATLIFLQLGAVKKILACVDAGPTKRWSSGYNFGSNEFAEGRARSHANKITGFAR